MVDLDKLTKRQRMAYLSKQSAEGQQQQQIVIGKHNKDSVMMAATNENVLYALANKKPEVVLSEQEDFEDEPIEEIELQPKKRGRSLLSKE